MISADTMLRVSPAIILRGPGNERTVMGNAAVRGELAGIDEVEEPHEPNASHGDPDEDYDDEDDDEWDEDDKDDEDEDEEFEYEDAPRE